MRTVALDGVKEAVADLFGQDPDVIAVYLFGSAARGSAGPGSDVDLAFLMGRGFDRMERFDFVLDANVRLEEALGIAVDVVLLNGADPVLQQEVRRLHALVLERDRSARLEWEVWSRKLWFDRQPAHRRYMNALSERYQREDSHGRSPRGG
ncbi:MAG: nucleotidyltransferase domain-containing protein [Deltaproteobacteria bacterium]|nr:nucleotidyltransferase domain-containing protein [Deltaproteobacteria bacterium]